MDIGKSSTCVGFTSSGKILFQGTIKYDYNLQQKTKSLFG
jgi:hypothetical protein